MQALQSRSMQQRGLRPARTSRSHSFRTVASASGRGSAAGKASDAVQKVQREVQKAGKRSGGTDLYGPNRPKVFGPFSENIVPSHLTGEYPGDYGWDWVGLCAEPERFAFLRQAEVMNGRWALLGVLGCLTPEFLVRYQGFNIFGDGIWFKTNASALTPEGASILGLNFGFGNNLPFLFVSTILGIGYVEAFRYNKSGGGFEGPYDPLYPGWDPLKVMANPDQAAALKVKELKNARLAMVAFLGFVVQGLVTGKGPLENLADHVSNPSANNAVAYISKANSSRILS